MVKTIKEKPPEQGARAAVSKEWSGDIRRAPGRRMAVI
jgi:hypothetical protein